MGVLVREAGALYESFAAGPGRPSPLPELPIQYGDYALWQRRWLAGAVLESQIAYWRQALAGVEPLELPTDRPRPAASTYAGATHGFRLPDGLAAAVEALARRRGATRFMALLAAFAALLHRYSGQDDLAVGVPIAGRTRRETEGLIGFFVNTLVLRADLAGGPGFAALVDQQRERTLAAYAHQDLPFETLIGELQPERHLARSPLFQTVFVMLDPDARPPRFAGLELEPLAAGTGTAKFDLTLTLGGGSGGTGFGGLVEYSTDLFEAATIGRLADHFSTLLAGDGRRSRGAGRRAALAHRRPRAGSSPPGTAPETPFPVAGSLHGRFAAQAARHALALGRGLRRRVARLRRAQRPRQPAGPPPDRARGGAESPVALCVERSLDMVVGILGHPQGGRRLRAARSVVSDRAPDLHRRGRAGRRGGAGPRHRRRPALGGRGGGRVGRPAGCPIHRLVDGPRARRAARRRAPRRRRRRDRGAERRGPAGVGGAAERGRPPGLRDLHLRLDGEAEGGPRHPRQRPPALRRDGAVVRFQRPRRGGRLDALPFLRLRLLGVGAVGGAPPRRPAGGRAALGRPLARGLPRPPGARGGDGPLPDAVGLPPARAGRPAGERAGAGPRPALRRLRRRGARARQPRAVARPPRRRAAAAHQHVRHHRDDGPRHLPGDRPRRPRPPARQPDRRRHPRPAPPPARPPRPAGGPGARGGDPRRRRRGGARLPGAPGPDRRALRPRPVVGGAGRAALPRRRPRPLPAGRRARVPRPRRRPGEDPRLPHRAGGDRGGARRATRRWGRRWWWRARTARATGAWSPT